MSLELAPGKIVKTTSYNGMVPGPVLRLREGKPVTINVTNDASYPDLVHWHGLYLPSVQDGAMEEGSPMIAPGQSLLYSFTPKPAGTRWYHSHAMAGTDLTRSTYSGEFGFLIVEPATGGWQIRNAYRHITSISNFHRKPQTAVLSQDQQNDSDPKSIQSA